MYKRKLQALNHPTSDKFDVNDENEFRSMVLWLEDQKIRHYKVEDRTVLRDLKSPDWDAAYRKYLDDLASPIKNKTRSEELEWLLVFAVSLEYGDNAAKYKGETSASVNSQGNVPKVTTSNVLDKLDFQSEDFVKGVKSLADMLQVTQHPDHLVTLKAISKLVVSRLSQDAIDNPDTVVAKGTPFPFQDSDLGFDTGDYVLNQASKVLRLLYIRDLRNLQTQINECIVAVQNVTANPKTDTKLGQVGR